MDDHGPRTQALRRLAEDDRLLTTKRPIMCTEPERNLRRVRRKALYTMGWALVAAAGCAAPIANRANTAGVSLVIQEQGASRWVERL